MLAIAAGLVRFYELDALEITADEAFSWRAATSSIPRLLTGVALDTHPPLHFVLEAAWIRCFDDSLFALRTLSVVAGIAAVAVVFAVVKGAAASSQAGAATIGASVSAGMLATHEFQVQQTRFARMYGVGILLCALSSWILLRALREENARRATYMWVAYGVITAFFALCHHFALFSILSQAIFISFECGQHLAQRSWRPAATLASRFALAGVIGLLIYSPWLPVFAAQTGRVQREYWISPLTSGELAQVAINWGAGQSSPLAAPAWAWLLVGGGLVTLAFRAGPAGRFFALATIVPWVAAIAVSTVGNRPLIQDRYLVFSHVGLVCSVGVIVDSIRPRIVKGATAFVVLAISIAGTGMFLTGLPKEQRILADTARFIMDGYEVGDVVVVPRPHTLHRLRYCFGRANRDDIDIRTPLDVSLSGGHSNHFAMLDENEVIRDNAELADVQRMWRLVEQSIAPRNVAMPDCLVRKCLFTDEHAIELRAVSVELFEQCVGPAKSDD